MLPAGPKQVELIEIINKPLLLHLVGYLYYWQMGFNSVFKGLNEEGWGGRDYRAHGEVTTMCRVVLGKPYGNRPLKEPGTWIGGGRALDPNWYFVTTIWTLVSWKRGMSWRCNYWLFKTGLTLWTWLVEILFLRNVESRDWFCQAEQSFSSFFK